MSEIKHRSSGYVDKKYWEEKEKLRKKAKKGFCWICEKKLPKRRVKYCSDKCFWNWYKQFNPPYLWNDVKQKVFFRDKFTCKKCGRTEKQLDEWYKNASKYFNRKIIADHIVPIALGGDEWDLKNLQTLCVDCNAQKTREDQRKIADLRKLIKKEKLGIPLKDFYKQTSLPLPPQPKGRGIRGATL